MQVVHREGPESRSFCFLKNPGPGARRARTVLSRKKNLHSGPSLYTTITITISKEQTSNYSNWTGWSTIQRVNGKVISNQPSNDWKLQA